MNDKNHTTLSIWVTNNEADWFKRLAEKKNKRISVFLNEILLEYKHRQDKINNTRRELDLKDKIKSNGKNFSFFFLNN